MNDLTGEAVAVVGDGTMGVALAHALTSAGRRCTLWCREASTARAISETHQHPKFFAGRRLSSALRASADLEETVKGSALVIVAVASSAFRATTEQLGRFVIEDQLLLSATKGFEPRSFRRLTDLIQELTKARNIGVLGGANITPDIMDGGATLLLVASTSRDALRRASRLLSGAPLHVHTVEDLTGVELISGFKNLVVITAGIAMGQRLSINTTSALVTKAFQEIQALALQLGAAPETALDLCGIGDVYVSCAHNASLNHRLGVELGAGKSTAEILSSFPEIPEGINSALAYVELSRRNGVSSPIGECVSGIIAGDTPVTSLARLVFP